MSEPIKVSDGSQPHKIFLMRVALVVGLLFVLGTAAFQWNVVPGLGGYQAYSVKTSNGTSRGSFTCGTTSSVAIAEYSGRTWLRISNTSTGTVFLGFSTNATDTVTVNTGIMLAPVGQVGSPQTSSTFSGANYYDSGASNVNWEGMVTCVANATGSVVSYIQSK